MKKSLVLLAVLIIGVISYSGLGPVGATRVPARAQAGGGNYERKCTVANVAGAYGAYGSGTFLPGNKVGVPPGLFATIGRAALDGQGASSLLRRRRASTAQSSEISPARGHIRSIKTVPAKSR